jgi:hypothetical protein
MSEDGTARQTRAKADPIKEHYSKAKRSYKTFDEIARIEYERLDGLNNKKALTPIKNPVEHAYFTWLSGLRNLAKLPKPNSSPNGKGILNCCALVYFENSLTICLSCLV